MNEEEALSREGKREKKDTKGEKLKRNYRKGAETKSKKSKRKRSRTNEEEEEEEEDKIKEKEEWGQKRSMN